MINGVGAPSVIRDWVRIKRLVWRPFMFIRRLSWILFLTLGSVAAVAHDHASAGKEAAAKAIEAYWAARNSRDHEAVWRLESRSGVLATMSDGSFHKPLNVSTPDQWKSQMQGIEASVQVHALELTEITPGVMFARYYLEGMSGVVGNPKPYRTRVTSIWIKESDGGWRQKNRPFLGSRFRGGVRTGNTGFRGLN